MDAPLITKPTADGRPARRKPESLTKIKKVARKLFVERGYHATRPRAVRRKSAVLKGVSLATPRRLLGIRGPRPADQDRPA